MRLEARRALVHHGEEILGRLRTDLRAVEAPDFGPLTEEARLFGIGERRNEAIVGGEEAVARGGGDPIE